MGRERRGAVAASSRYGPRTARDNAARVHYLPGSPLDLLKPALQPRPRYRDAVLNPQSSVTIYDQAPSRSETPSSSASGSQPLTRHNTARSISPSGTRQPSGRATSAQIS